MNSAHIFKYHLDLTSLFQLVMWVGQQSVMHSWKRGQSPKNSAISVFNYSKLSCFFFFHFAEDCVDKLSPYRCLSKKAFGHCLISLHRQEMINDCPKTCSFCGKLAFIEGVQRGWEKRNLGWGGRGKGSLSFLRVRTLPNPNSSFVHLRTPASQASGIYMTWLATNVFFYEIAVWLVPCNAIDISV